jgi:hypothetical protein
MNIDVSQVWKGVVVMLTALVVFVVSAQAFALGSGPDELRQVDATFEVEPTAENQGDATFEVEPTAELDGRHLQGGAHHLLDAAFEGVFTVELDGRHLQGGAHHLMDMGADPGLLGASGHTGADPPGTVEAATSKAVTLSARVREPSGVTGTVDFTFEIETPPDALDLPAGDVLVGFPATFPTQRVTLREETSSIPEPAVLVLVGLGVIGLALLRRIWGRGTHP